MEAAARKRETVVPNSNAYKQGFASNEDAVIFDSDHSLAILRSVSGGEKEGRKLSRVEEEALLSLLLFGKAKIVNPHDDDLQIAVETLRREAWVETIPDEVFLKPFLATRKYLQSISSEWWSKWGGADETIRSDHAFNRRLYERLLEYYFPLISGSMGKAVPGAGTLKSDFIEHYSLFEVPEIHAIEDELPDPADAGSVGRNLLSPGIFQTSPHNDYRFWKWSTGKHDPYDIYSVGLLGPRPFDFLRNPRKFLDRCSVKGSMLSRVSTKLVEYGGLCAHARDTGIPLKARCKPAEGDFNAVLGPKAFQLFKVRMEEIRVLPRIEGLDDVRRLRGHKYIDNFRAALLEWLNRITNGEVSHEKKYRQALQIANGELRKLEKRRFLRNPYWVILSITLGIADVLAQAPIGPFVSAISGPALFDQHRKKRKYGYAIFPT
jgi:hypothetical protein